LTSSIDTDEDHLLSPETQALLSPDAQSSSLAFFESKHDMPFEELDANKVWPKDSASPAMGISIFDPSTHTRISSNLAATAGVPQYTIKPLPLRPGQGTENDPDWRRLRRRDDFISLC